MFNSVRLPSPDTPRRFRRRAVGAVLVAVLASAGCGPTEKPSYETGAQAGEVLPQTSSYEPCSKDYDPEETKGGFTMRAAKHHNRITDCVLVPSKANLLALDQLFIESKRARANNKNGSPSATTILANHYRTDFGLPAAKTPLAARDALVAGKSFRDVTKKINAEDLPYLTYGLVVIGTDTLGKVDVSISLGTNSQPDNKAHNGRSGLLNSDGLTDSKVPISEHRLDYVLAPIGKSRPRG